MAMCSLPQMTRTRIGPDEDGKIDEHLNEQIKYRPSKPVDAAEEDLIERLCSIT